MPALRDGYEIYQHDHARAMAFSWHVGLTVLALAGVFKIVLAPLGNAVRRFVPGPACWGRWRLSCSYSSPSCRCYSTALPRCRWSVDGADRYSRTLIAHRQLPFKFPGALAAVLVGRAGLSDLPSSGATFKWPLVPAPPSANEVEAWQPGALVSFYGAGEWSRVFWYALAKLPVMLPFALATIVGGIDCTESAAAAGDEYDTRAVLLTEGAASLAAGLLGGVIQTTPYIGHPAYKKMGGRAAYTLATALFVGSAGYFGWFNALFEWLPTAAMFPILVFVGLEITAQSFQATPTRHYPALALAALPALAYLITIPLNTVLGGDRRRPMPCLWCRRCAAWPTVSSLRAVMGGGVGDDSGRPIGGAAAFLALAGVCAFFGVIHSPLASERIGLPYDVLLLVQQQAAGWTSGTPCNIRRRITGRRPTGYRR